MGIKSLFAVSKYDVQKDEEMNLKDKIFAITNNIDYKIQSEITRSKSKVEKLRNSKSTRLDKLNRKLTRIRMAKFNDAKYVYEDSCLAEVLKAEQKELNEQIKPIKKEGK